jgi:hypothetical protein
MDGFSLSGVCILVEDGDDFATLSLDDGAGRNDGDINHLMVVNPLDVDELSCLVNDANISTRDATIGSTIEECPSSVGTMIRGMVDGVVGMGLAVDLAIDGDLCQDINPVLESWTNDNGELLFEDEEMRRNDLSIYR